MTGKTNKDRQRLERERVKAQKERRKRIEKAAPDLLVACQLAVYRLCIGDGDIQARINEVLPKLRAALDKAGEA